jgi:hypothetical protein
MLCQCLLDAARLHSTAGLGGCNTVQQAVDLEGPFCVPHRFTAPNSLMEKLSSSKRLPPLRAAVGAWALSLQSTATLRAQTAAAAIYRRPLTHTAAPACGSAIGLFGMTAAQSA